MTNPIVNNMSRFNLEDLQYLYNCAGDFVGDDVPATYDIESAKTLAQLVEKWDCAENAVVLRYGKLGVMVELLFSLPDSREQLIEKLRPVYEKFNGTQHIAVGLLEHNDELWPQLFIPAAVVLGHPQLTDAVREAYLTAVGGF